MNVELLGAPQEPLRLVYVACRTCYSSKKPTELWVTEAPEADQIKLIKSIIASGHHSVLEHVNLTFAIEGVSRVLTHQLVRHRHASYSQQSQRYAKAYYNKGDMPKEIASSDGYIQSVYVAAMESGFENYQKLVDLDVSLETARMVAPFGSTSNIMMTLNLRELIHICQERLCSRAQDEIQQMVMKMAKLAIEYFPLMKEYLKPKCMSLGYCPERDQGECKVRPPKQEVLEAYQKVAREKLNGTISDRTQ